MNATTVKETKKKSHRAKQREHATYKKKIEISEGLSLVKPFLNVSTYKYLSHFLHTDGTGVTQAKISVICQKVGIAERTYYKIVKPQIETFFDQPLIITTKAPMKYCSKRKKRVRSSEYKSLLPLSIIKVIVEQKRKQEEQEYLIEWDQFEPQSTVESAVESAVESNDENPWESKSEESFQLQKNKSFREDLKDSKVLYYTPPSYKGENIKPDQQVKTFLTSYKGYRNNPYWDEPFKNKVALYVQQAIEITQVDIHDKHVQHVIKNKLGDVINYYEGNNHGENHYLNLIRKCLIVEINKLKERREENRKQRERDQEAFTSMKKIDEKDQKNWGNKFNLLEQAIKQRQQQSHEYALV